MRFIIAASSALLAAGASAQTAPRITLYELPGYLGRSVTISEETPDLADQSFASRARSARVTGEWRICPAVEFGGSCRTVSSDQPLLTRSQVVSLRPAASTGAGSSTGSGTGTGSAGSSAALDLDALDVGTGTEGQDATFYPRPTLGGSEVSAGTNDIAAASAFCRLAGGSNASAAARARTQASNLVDVNARSRVRGYALRDVLCRR